MRTTAIPQTNVAVSRIGYGGLARPELLDSGIAGVARLVHTAFDCGITLFDLANVYGMGRSEEVFGEVLTQSPGFREAIVLQSKCGFRLPSESGNGAPPYLVDLSSGGIVRSLEGSLRRLGTDRVDILLLHVPDALVEPEEVASAFDQLHTGGKVLHFGVSNHSVAQIELLRRHVRQPLVTSQIPVSLAQLITDHSEASVDAHMHELKRRLDQLTQTLDECRLRNLQVQAYSPLRTSVERAPDLITPDVGAQPTMRRVAQLLEELAAEKGVTPAAIAIAWLMRHPAEIVPIIGTVNPQHVVENCAADAVELTREEWYRLVNAAAGI
jgi:predicted oxidoreductase